MDCCGGGCCGGCCDGSAVQKVRGGCSVEVYGVVPGDTGTAPLEIPKRCRRRTAGAPAERGGMRSST